MLKYSVAVAALLLAAPAAFAQSTHEGGAGMSNSGSGASSSGMGSSRSSDTTSGRSSDMRSSGSSGASEGSSGSGSSASQLSPGHEKGSGSAKEYAPGQRKSEGSARDLAPGQEKKTDRHSENSSKGLKGDESTGKRSDNGDTNRDRNATNNRDKDRKDRNATNDRDKDRSDRNARNERDDNRGNAERDRRDQARGDDRSGASVGASTGTEGRSDHPRGSITSVTTEQRTRVRSIFTEHRVEPARDLHVSVNVGTRIPHSVHLYPVPDQVISIVPEYRGYEYILLDDDRVAIIDPDTFEVVDIIEIA
jgi:hypothetical protein